MILKEEIIRVAGVKAKELDGFIIDVIVSSKNDIIVYFDKKEGVKVDHCVLISRYINENFDRDIEDYGLTVCSPGLTNPFKIKDQYIINQGKEVTVKKNDGKKISGILKKIDNNLTLEVKNKAKGSSLNYRSSDIVIPFEEIKETKLKINFK